MKAIPVKAIATQGIRGKTVIVTGATSGLGEAIAKNIAEQGADLVVVSRSEARCAAAAARLQRETGNPTVRFYAADLSVQKEVRGLAATLKRDLIRLDVLVNNAGAWFTERKESADGIEMTWALNHLSYFLLTHELTELLKRTAAEHGEARIVNQASSAHHEGRMHWENLEFRDNWAAEGKGSTGPGWGVYSQSKLANVLHAFALARRLAGTGVVANAVHPGTVVTGFSTNNGLVYRLAAPVRQLFNRATAQQGAAPAIFLAASEEASAITGAYYGPPQKREAVNPIAEDIAAQERLWNVSLKQVGLSAKEATTAEVLGGVVR